MRSKKALQYDKQWKREIEKEVSKFSQPLMSSSKWIKLIGKLVEHNDIVLKILFKKIQHENMGELYLADDPDFGFEYWHSGFELNNSFHRPLAFNEIEYLVFPKIVDPITHQDIKAIEVIIQSVGTFCLESDENGLKLVCYRK